MSAYEWMPLKTAPRDRIVWLWHRSWAGGPTLGFWNDRREWWSSTEGAGSCLISDEPDPKFYDSAESIFARQCLWFPAFPPFPAQTTHGSASGTRDKDSRP